LAVVAKSQQANPEANLPAIPPDAAKQNLISSVQPDYPPLAKAAHISGMINV
jgi:hypothetical protein